MPEAVIDHFEVIDVEQQYRSKGLTAFRVADRPDQMRPQLRAVQHSGQGIATGLPPQYTLLLVALYCEEQHLVNALHRRLALAQEIVDAVAHKIEGEIVEVASRERNERQIGIFHFQGKRGVALIRVG